jgi:glucuronoarabinoxylan endo-1,4-beta-xylanase
VTISTATQHQTLVGFGAAIAYYAGYLTGRNIPDDDIYQVLFADLGLDVLRIGNWYQNQRSTGTTTDTAFGDAAIAGVIQGATTALGHAPIVLMASWSPPSYLKSNGATKGTQGTLSSQNGEFDYAGFADWWVRSLSAYAAQGVTPDYVSIQNEPDYFNAGWETCLLSPAAAGGNAVYAQALDAVYQAFQSSTTLAAKPQLIGPEPSGIANSTVQNYLARLNMDEIAAVAHHLYNGGDGSAEPAPESFGTSMSRIAGAADGKPLFMTEFSPSAPTLIGTAALIHQALTVEGVSAYVYWDLIWPPSTSSHPLVTVPSPASVMAPSKGYTLNDTYYAVQHFAKWTDPGWTRVDASSNLPAIKVSAFRSPDGGSLTVVLVNTGSDDRVVTLDAGGFPFASSALYRTSGTSERVSPAEFGPDNSVSMPAQSIATITFLP